MKLTLRKFLISIAALTLGLFAAGSASAQTLYTAIYDGTVGRYDVSDTNNIISNTSFISGFSLPHALVISGSTLYVADYDTSTVSSYNLSNGNAINASLISSSNGLGSPNAMAISGNTLYVADYGNGTIGSFNLTTSTYNASFISGFSNPTALAISGSTLYIATAGGYIGGAGKVGTYDLANNGTAIDLSYISALSSPSALAIDGTVLYIGDYDGKVQTHNLDSNTQRDPSLILAPDTVYALAVTSAVPEPSTYALFAGIAVLGLAALRRYRRV